MDSYEGGWSSVRLIVYSGRLFVMMKTSGVMRAGKIENSKFWGV